jgi:hypothetical protein
MKQFEIDSDRYTTLAICALLLLAFWRWWHARDLFWFAYHPEPRTWPNYLISIFFAYVLFASLRDRKLWHAYPYGAAAFGLFLTNFVLGMALPRHSSGAVVMIHGFVGLAAWLLIILEIARWFRQKVRTVQSACNGGV